jgi:transmembrane sensor
MEKSNFDELLKRYITGEVSEHERTKLEAWLDAMKTKNRDNLELSEDDEEKLFQKILSKHDNLAEIKTMIPERKRVSWLGWSFRIAASMLVIALVTYIAWNLGKQNNGVIEFASYGSIEKVLLPDNSLVWLKGNSKIIYYEKEEENIRYAELKGEGLFEVAKDPSHPFVINCGNATLTVLGTSFSVRATVDSIELTVLTGKVNITMAKNGAGVDVLPNEKVIFPRNGEIKKLALAKDEVSSITSGTEYDLSFNNISLSDITKRLEKKFNTNISIENPHAGACSITIDLTDKSLDRSMEMITEILDVGFRRQGDSIIVSGQGCKE